MPSESLSPLDIPQTPGPVVADRYPSFAVAAYATLILSVTLIVAFVNRSIFTVVAQPLKLDLGLSDAAVGALQGLALYLFFGLAAIPLGRYVDFGHRRNLLAASVAGWSLFTFLGGLADGFWELFLCRVGVGVAEACVAPAIYSLLWDLFPPRRRIQANLAFFCVAVAGASASIALSGLAYEAIASQVAGMSGWLGTLQPWRLTLFAVSLPGVIIIALLLTIPEPTRKEIAAIGAAGAPGYADVWRFLFRNRAFYLLLIPAFGILTFANDAVVAWMPSILNRVLDMPVGEAGFRFGTAFGIGSVLGVAIASLCCHVLQKRHGGVSTLFTIQIGIALSIPCVLLIPLLPFDTSWFGLILAYSLFAFIAGGLDNALLMSVTPNQYRGQTIAIYKVTVSLMAAFSPMTVGLLSDHVYGGPRALLDALLTVLIPLTVLGFVLLLVMTRAARARFGEVEGR